MQKEERYFAVVEAVSEEELRALEQPLEMHPSFFAISAHDGVPARVVKVISFITEEGHRRLSELRDGSASTHLMIIKDHCLVDLMLKQCYRAVHSVMPDLPDE